MRAFLMIVIAFALAGCSSLDRPYPDRQLYVFSASESDERASASDDAPLLRVSRAVIAAPFGSRAMQYRVGDNQFEPDYYHAWADDPGKLIAGAAIEALNAQGSWRAVLDDGSMAAPSQTLELYVDALYADVTGSSTQAVLSVRATLLDDDQFVLMSERFEERRDVPRGDPAALVEAWNGLLDEMLGRIARQSS